MPSRRSWVALLFAGLGVAVAVHRGSTLLQTWRWEELGNVQPLLWLPISFRQPQNENATAYLVQVGDVSEEVFGSVAFFPCAYSGHGCDDGCIA